MTSTKTHYFKGWKEKGCQFNSTNRLIGINYTNDLSKVTCKNCLNKLRKKGKTKEKLK